MLNGSEMGQTFGKRAMYIQVRDVGGSGGTIGAQRAALRYVTGRAVPDRPVLRALHALDGLWPLWDRHRQALHDKIAGSVVVRVTPVVTVRSTGTGRVNRSSTGQCSSTAAISFS